MIDPGFEPFGPNVEVNINPSVWLSIASNENVHDF